MKLPDFEIDPGLNELRNAMGATLGDYKPASPGNVLTSEEVKRLQNEGIEIPIDDIRVLNDGTYIYKGRRVVVYIRDVASYNDKYELPKFHLAVCNVLVKMMDQGRYKKRYVVAAREDGIFKIHKIRNNEVSPSDERLDICQVCLDELYYEGFSLQMGRDQRSNRVREFALKAFFEKFERTCVWAVPMFDAEFAPPNIYSVNFFRFAKVIKEQRGYKCESCTIDLSLPDDQRFLHAHHIDADKTDNRPANINLLCIRCHADQFQHSHLKANPDYDKFCKRFGLKN
ncbi:MAG: HNH endonuclease signature motif containing protein [Xanthobacteraceae bacterium]